jgi:hypothetical protein
MTNGDQHDRNRFLDLAMIAVFDLAGPLVAYSLLRSAGQSAARVIIVETTSTGTALTVSKAMPYVVGAALAAWMFGYGRHARRKGERLAAEAQAAEAQAAEAQAAEAQAAIPDLVRAAR